MSPLFKEKRPLLLFVFSVAFLIYFFASWKWQPDGLVRTTVYDAVWLYRHWRHEFGVEPTRFLVTAQAGRERFAIADETAMAPGYRLVAGLIGAEHRTFGAALYDANGREVHFWPVDYALIDPQGPDPWLVFMHGIEVFPDGSIVVNFDDSNAMARFDACGRVLWKRRGQFHHVIEKAPDGSVWTWDNLNLTLLNFADGEVLDSIHLADRIMALPEFEGVGSLMTEEDAYAPVFMADPYHPNDIDILPAGLARAFPMFEAGDVMISLRSLNLIAVIDAGATQVKWWRIGPWHRQHDPDFAADGSVLVYDNRMGFKRSRIIRAFPGTGRHEVVFEGSAETPFYSWRRGKHQPLANGNVLVTESEAGRVLEITTEGRIVWTHDNTWDAARNGIVNKAMMLPEGFFEAGALNCPG